MGNLVKTVELRILAAAGDAQRQLDEVAGKADELGAKDIKMKFRLEDGNARAQMDEIRAKAERLGLKDISIRVRVDGAGRAVAELAAVRHEAEKLERKQEEAAAGGMIGRLLGLGGSGGGGMPGGLPLIGGMPLPALAALIPAIGAVATEVTGLVSGFAAAGTGAGAFAVLALPAFKKVETAYQGISAAQAKYDKARLTEEMAPSKTHLKDVQTALLGVREAWTGLTPQQAMAVHSIQQLSASYHKLAKSFEPQAFKIFNDGLKIANHLLPAVKPFADTFATSLDGLLKRTDKFTQSKGFADFLKQFHSIEGPAVNAIGTGIGKVVESMGKLLTVMSGKDVAHTINIAFGAISGIISGAASGIHRFMQNWDQMSAAAARVGHAVGSAFSSMSGRISGVVHDVVSSWHSMVSGIESGGAAVIHFVSSLPGKIKGFFAGAGSWLLAAGRNIVMGLVHGIESAAGSVAGAIGHIASTIRSFLPFSPAKRGPLSGQGSPQIAGQKIAQGIATGLQGGQGAINAAMTAIGNIVAGPDSKISASIAKLKAMVSGSHLGSGQKMALTAMLDLDNQRLQALAAQRKKIEQEIQLSEQTAQAAIQELSITNAQQAATAEPAEPVSPDQLIAGMKSQAAAAKQFAQQIRQLQKDGLNSTTLSQIIGAGAGGGGPLAQSLLSGGKGAIGQINQLEAQIKASAAKLGDSAAPALYQAGVQAGQGLAAGLKSQLGKISGAMQDLAHQLVEEVKRELHIKSPSQVMRLLGQQTGQGFELGVRDWVPRVAAAGGHMAGAAAAGASAGLGYGGRGGDLHVHFHGVFAGDKYGTAREVHALMRDYKRNRGGGALGLG